MATITELTAKNGTISYKVEIRLKGFPRQTATFKRKTDARKWIASTESAIRENRHFKTSASKKNTLGDAIDKYSKDILTSRYTVKEQRNRRPILTWWKNEIGFYVMADLTTATFAECRDALAKKTNKSGKPFSSDSVKKYFCVIKSVLRACVVDWLWLEQSPLRDNRVDLPELPQGRVRYLNDDERQRLLKACQASSNPLLYPAFILALSTGMRQGETMNLYWKEPARPPLETAWGVVNLEQRCIVLHQTKNGLKRRVPLIGLALSEIQKLAQMRQTDSELIFPSPSKPQQPIDLKAAWLNALKRAEIANFRWHDIRHTTASYLAMNGATLAEIAEVLGHKTLAMVKRYAHLSDGHVSHVVASMNSKIFGVVENDSA
jgi:integrase